MSMPEEQTSQPGEDSDTCAVCGISSSERIGGVTVCSACKPQVLRRPFPAWLRAGASALLILLALDLYWGARYWPPARDYILAQRQADAGHWEDAAVLLRQVLAEAPDSEPALFLSVKADLLRGDLAAAEPGIQQLAGREIKSATAKEVAALLERVYSAVEKFDEAKQLAEQGEDAKALEAIEAAVAAYPEASAFQTARDIIRAGLLFSTGNYAGFTEHANRLRAAYPENAQITLMVSSGLAAQYAASGDEQLAAESRRTLEAGLALGSEDEQSALTLYAERIRHRLATREIIEAHEYERRKAAGEIR